MEEFDKIKDFSKIATLLNWAMFFVHTSLLLFFYFCQVTFMFYFNIGSVSLYLVNFYVIKKKYFRVFLILTVLEFLLHLIAATICCGWDSGFALYNFAMIGVIHYTKYIYSDIKGMNVFVQLVTFGAAFIFLFLSVFSYYFTPFYDVSYTFRYLYFANGMLSLALIILSLMNFSRGALSSERSLHELADYDELTLLFNRHKMNEILNGMCEEKKASQSKNSCYISILDIDDFKQINDTYGHNAGDYVLKTIARLMKEVTKQTRLSHVCRWGGEEFLIVQSCSEDEYEGLCGKSLVLKVLEKVRNYDFDYDSHHIPVTMTAGIATPASGDSVLSVIQKADESLYWGKQHGKNQLVENYL